MAESRPQSSESFWVSAILSLSGGFQDAYTYYARGSVFANAQTGNVVLMGHNFMEGQWAAGLRYLFPLLSFAFGIVVSEAIEHRYKVSQKIHWRQIVLIIEIALLIAVGFMPEKYNMIANMMVSLSCAMQVQTFRKFHGYGYASTMCIGNLRNGTESLTTYLITKDRADLVRMFHYYGIIVIFAFGAGIGSIATLEFGLRAIWASAVLLACVFLIMRSPETQKGIL